MIEVPDVPSLRLGATRERVDFLPDCRSRCVVVHCGRRNPVGPNDVGSRGLEHVVDVMPRTAAELDLGMERDGSPSRFQLQLPPLSGICLLGVGEPHELETLTGQQVSERPAEEDLVKPLAEDMRRVSHGVEVQVFRVPSAVEEVLRRDPRVLDCAVVGAMDALAGESVVAFVVTATDSEPPSELDLRRLCATSLESYKVLRRIRFIEVIPKTAVAK